MSYRVLEGTTSNNLLEEDRYFKEYPLHQLRELYDLYEGKKEQFTPEKLEAIIEQIQDWAVLQVEDLNYPQEVRRAFMDAVEAAMFPACFTVAAHFGKNALMTADIPKSMREYTESARNKGRELYPDLKTDKDFHCFAGYVRFDHSFKRIKAALTSKEPVFELEEIVREIEASKVY